MLTTPIEMQRVEIKEDESDIRDSRTIKIKGPPMTLRSNHLNAQRAMIENLVVQASILQDEKAECLSCPQDNNIVNG